MAAVTVGFHETVVMTVLILVGFVLLPPACLAVPTSPVDAGTSDAMFVQDDHLKLSTDETSFKTIESPEGDLIDCVPIHLQPAFDLPQLRGQKLQDLVPKTPEGGDPADGSEGKEPHEISFQPWLATGETCPDGTVPIRRTTEQDLEININTRKLKRETMASGGTHSTIPTNANAGYEFASGKADGTYYGAQAAINVWAPHVANRQEFSLAQLWVAAGSGSSLNAIEVGWQVYQRKYGDNRPRLFIYWTADGYRNTGCYNLDCPGFVQTNPNVALGGALAPVSTYNGPQYEMTVLVWKDPNTRNWWLRFQGQNVGYWPASLFNTLSQSSSQVGFGGEVYTASAVPHAQMGSGHFSGEGFGKAAFFRNLLSVNANNQYASVPRLTPIVTSPRCFDFQESFGGSWDHYFYYGGPGC